MITNFSLPATLAELYRSLNRPLSEIAESNTEIDKGGLCETVFKLMNNTETYANWVPISGGLVGFSYVIVQNLKDSGFIGSIGGLFGVMSGVSVAVAYILALRSSYLDSLQNEPACTVGTTIDTTNTTDVNDVKKLVDAYPIVDHLVTHYRLLLESNEAGIIDNSTFYRKRYLLCKKYENLVEQLSNNHKSSSDTFMNSSGILPFGDSRISVVQDVVHERVDSDRSAGRTLAFGSASSYLVDIDPQEW